MAPRGPKPKEVKLTSTDRREKAMSQAQAAAPQSLAAAATRVDVRGMRADEALREVEGTLDKALRGGDPSVLIVHGHGTGALRQSIREYLAGSGYVRMFRPGEAHEGGDGVTVVAF